MKRAVASTKIERLDSSAEIATGNYEELFCKKVYFFLRDLIFCAFSFLSLPTEPEQELLDLSVIVLLSRKRKRFPSCVWSIRNIIDYFQARLSDWNKSNRKLLISFGVKFTGFSFC